MPHLHLGLFGVSVRSSIWRMRNARLSTTERTCTLFNSPTSDREPMSEREKMSISLNCHLPASAVRAFVSSAVPPSSRLSTSHFCTYTEKSLDCQRQPHFIVHPHLFSWWAEKPCACYSSQFSRDRLQKWSLYSDFPLFASNTFPLSSSR